LTYEIWLEKEDLTPSGLYKFVKMYQFYEPRVRPADAVIDWPSPVAILTITEDPKVRLVDDGS
jgi:hypothetical protein